MVRIKFLTVAGLLTLVFASALMAPGRPSVRAQEQDFVGGIVEDRETAERAPVPVRNDVHQPGEEIVTLRLFRIEKGRFPDFYKASAEGVWPYFEKLGARVVGQWVVIHPETDMGQAGQGTPDYDDVYLMTRYASVEHWRATRDMSAHGGNGPDWEKCREALAFRRSITQETSVQFLKGHLATNGPYFMPGLDEEYLRK